MTLNELLDDEIVAEIEITSFQRSHQMCPANREFLDLYMFDYIAHNSNPRDIDLYQSIYEGLVAMYEGVHQK